VPAEEITGAEPGELFVHRNVANLVIPTDLNLLSVLQYAVEVLQVKHIIVCGHYNCGGIKSSMSNLRNLGPINDWLQHLRDLYDAHRHEMESIPDAQGRWDHMVEVNVKEQLQELARTSIVQRTWSREMRPILHGWTYNLRTGYLNELSVLEPQVQVNQNIQRAVVE
jgi:carbonic anhydrase